MKRKTAAILIVSAIVGYGVFTFLTMASPRRALLLTGSDVHEYRREFGFLPDFDYYLSAEIATNDFESFANRLNLLPVSSTNPIDGTGVDWGNCPESWWPKDLPMSNARFNYDSGGQMFAVASMHNGRLYYHAIGW